MARFGITRRRFLYAAGGMAATAAGSVGLYRGTQTAVPIGVIGLGLRGMVLAGTLARRWYRVYGDMRAVCDVDRPRAEEARHKFCPRADVYQDYRRVLEREDLRAVIVATPDHWHAKIASDALRAGKAVYLEKPISLTIDEGKHLVRTVRETGGLLLVGTQQRSDWRFQRACELVRNERLGQLKRVTVQLDENPVGGPFAAEPVPEHLDWDLWLGQAPAVEYCPARCHMNFRFWYEYGGGEIADWGVHHADIAQWAMGMDDSGPLAIDGEGELPHIENGFNVPRRFDVEMTYANDVRLRIVTADRKGILFEGDRGRIFVNRGALQGKPVEDLKSRPLPPDAERFGHAGRYWEWDGAKNVHLRHFFDCLLNGRQPISDIASQHRSASVCHLANICLRLGHKLRWDPVREAFVGDDAANAMRSRPQRAPYGVDT
jgi:myo-inositol 2-dehydrogenase/D-chiro-inositol 1-dehydrogenase